MSEEIKVIADREDIVSIADAVRSQTGSTEQMTLSQIATEVANISGGGSAPSWNDLLNRPFGDNEDGTVTQLDNKYLSILESHKNTNDLLSSTTGTSQFFDTYQMYGISVDTTAEMLSFWHQTNQQDVLVDFDGETYSCTPQYVEAISGVMIGNCSAFGGIGNNEPFVISVTANGTESSLWLIGALADSSATEHTVRIYQLTDEDVYTIKNEYLSIMNYVEGNSGFEYLPETTFTCDPSVSSTIDDIYSTEEIYNKFVANTNPVTVVFDEIEYICEVQTAQGITFIGNASSIGGSSNNEPFMAAFMKLLNEDTHIYEYVCVVQVLHDSVATEHTIRIYQDGTPDNYVLKYEYLPQPTSIDLSGFDTNGTIVETYADGISKTTTIEFDDNGNPIKITDGDGNVTTLTW